MISHVVKEPCNLFHNLLDAAPAPGADLLIFGGKKVDKKLPATTEQTIVLLTLMSTLSIPMMDIFPLLAKFLTLHKPKSVGAS